MAVLHVGVSHMINPRRNTRGKVVVLCVCVLPHQLLHTWLIRCKQVAIRLFYGIIQVCIVWISLKMLRSKVLATFADHHGLLGFLTSSQSMKETAMASLTLGACAARLR